MRATKSVRVEGRHSIYEADMFFTDNGCHLIVMVYFYDGGRVMYTSIDGLLANNITIMGESEEDSEAIKKILTDWNEFCEEYK